MDSSTVGARLPNRRPESCRGSESSFSEHFYGTIRFPPIDPFRVNSLSELRNDPSFASLVGGSDATRYFKPITSSTVCSFNRIGYLQSTPFVTR